MKFILAMLFLAVAANAQDCPKNLKMGWELYQPYQFEEENKIKGIDIEILDQAMADVGCSFKKIKMPWKRLLLQIENGKMDIAAGASPSPDRRAFAYFSSPYNSEPVNLYLRKDEVTKYDLKTAQDLVKNNLKIGAMDGAYNGPEFENLVNEKKLNSQNLFFANVEKQLFEMLLSKRIDVVIIGGDVINYNNNVVHYPQPIFKSDVAFMFSKKTVNEEFVKKFSQSIEKLKNEGKIKNIISSYLQNKNEKY